MKKILICAMVVIALVFVYLFALNGRYDKIEGAAYFDKWTKTILIINKTEEIN